MPDDNKKTTRITPVRPSRTAAPSSAGQQPKRGWRIKNRSTAVILGTVLLLVVIWLIVSAVQNNAKYDIYAMNKADVLNSVHADYKPFVRLIAEQNEYVGVLLKSGEWDDDIELELMEYRTLVKNYDVPRQLIRVQAAQLDFLNYSYRNISGRSPVSADVLDKAAKKLSVELTKVIK